MRRLLYVPIIHMSADLGSIAEYASRRGKAFVGDELWEQHRKSISDFWGTIRTFSNSVKAEGLKIYQDGMLARGEACQRIVEEAVEKGSENYRIVSDLMGRGAELMLTEDYKLAKKERDLLVALSENNGSWKRLWAYIKYKILKGPLLKKRDRFIASRIDKTLGENETGVLFLGAAHDVCSKLPQDIEVVAVKSPEKIAGYQKSLLRAAILGNSSNSSRSKRLKELSDYLAEPIDVPFETHA